MRFRCALSMQIYNLVICLDFAYRRLARTIPTCSTAMSRSMVSISPNRCEGLPWSEAEAFRKATGLDVTRFAAVPVAQELTDQGSRTDNRLSEHSRKPPHFPHTGPPSTKSMTQASCAPLIGIIKLMQFPRRIESSISFSPHAYSCADPQESRGSEWGLGNNAGNERQRLDHKPVPFLNLAP